MTEVDGADVSDRLLAEGVGVQAGEQAGPPKRVQVVKRDNGYGIPPGAVYVGRPMRGKLPATGRFVATEFGNPHPVGRACRHCGGAKHTQAEAVELYRRHLDTNPQLRTAAAVLAGTDLACWCEPDQPCHADVLLEIANSADTEEIPLPPEPVRDADEDHVTHDVTHDTPSDQQEHRSVTRVTGVTEVREPPQTSWTAAEILATDFPEPRWAVEGLVAEGLTVLAGGPKLGKSWLGLGLCVSVATGGKALGKVKVAQGPALYLALEDTARRLKTRLAKITSGERHAGLGELTILTQCPPMPSGGDAVLVDWLDLRPDARLIVIDVFAKVRGRAPAGTPMYDADYAAVSRIKAVADHYGIAIVVVHHTRKQESEDFLDSVSGSQGVAGAADAVMVLERRRGEADGILRVTGRDIDEAEYGLDFSPDLGAWTMLDAPVVELTMGDTQRAIFGYLRDNHPEPSRPKDIAEKLGLNDAAVRQRLRQMLDENKVDSDGKGNYWAPHGSVTPVTDVTQAPSSQVSDPGARDAERDAPRHARHARPCTNCGERPRGANSTVCQPCFNFPDHYRKETDR